MGEVLHSGITKVKTFALELPGGPPPETPWAQTGKGRGRHQAMTDARYYRFLEVFLRWAM
jgi:hypothetical protein